MKEYSQKIIKIKGENPYNIYLTNHCKDIVEKLVGPAKKVLIISEQKSFTLRSARILSAIENTNAEIYTHIFPAGTKIVGREALFKVVSSIIDLDFKKGDLIVALGDREIGGIAGLVGSLCRRDIKVITVPTSLNYMIDVVNHDNAKITFDNGKKSVGQKVSPKAVVVDLDFIDTVPESERGAVYTEIIRSAIVCGGKLYKTAMEENVDFKKLMLTTILCKAQLKNAKKEAKIAKLKLGDKIRYGIEKSLKKPLAPGVALAYSLKLAADLSENDFGGKDVYQKVITLLDKFGFSFKKTRKFQLSFADIVFKKTSENDKVSLFIPIAIGDVREFSMSIEDFKVKLSSHKEFTLKV